MLNKFPKVFQNAVYLLIFLLSVVAVYDIIKHENKNKFFVHPKTTIFAFLLLFTSIAGNYYNLRQPIRDWLVSPSKNYYIQETIRFIVIFTIAFLSIDIQSDKPLKLQVATAFFVSLVFFSIFETKAI